MAAHSMRPKRSSRASTCRPPCVRRPNGKRGRPRSCAPAAFVLGLDAYNRYGLFHQHATQAEARAGIVAEWKAIERGSVDRDGIECGIET